MLNEELIKSHIEHIIKKTFGKNGLKHLKITSNGSSHIYTNIFHFHGFLLNLFVTIQKDGTYKTNILFFKHYNYGYEIDIRCINEVNTKKSKHTFNYEKNLGERVAVVEYYPNIINDFYEGVKYVLENLDLTQKNGEYIYNNHLFNINGNIIKNRHFELDVFHLKTKDYKQLVLEINQFKQLNISNGYLKLV